LPDKVIRKSEKAHYEAARQAHDERLVEHEGEVTAVYEMNRQVQDDHAETLRVLREKASEQHQNVVDRYDAAVAERQQAIDDGADAETLPEPSPPPADPDPPPEVREPVMVDPPPEPTLRVDPPTVFMSKEVTEFEEVETPDGPALAAPGTFVLTSEAGVSHIVTADTLQREYEAAG